MNDAISPSIDVINEFAAVRVRKVDTRHGVRLEISSERLGYTIQLDALALESLTWQRMDAFSHFLRTPLGPTDHDDDYEAQPYEPPATSTNDGKAGKLFKKHK